MSLNKRRLLLPYHLTKIAAISGLVAFLAMVNVGAVWSQDEPMPARIKDLKMGASLSSVAETIKPEGTNSTEEIPDQKRQKLTWVTPDNPYYANLQFQFTEKDRLYMIRFSLKNELWRKSLNLKRAFFQKFSISPENPLKLRVKNQDILVYGADGGDCDFLDFTEATTGEKWFVLVNKGISADDRTKAGNDSKESKDESKGN